jgi:uncharacterized membrane protein
MGYNMKYKYLLLTAIFLAAEFGLYHLTINLINSSDDMLVFAGFAVLLVGGPIVMFTYVDWCNRLGKVQEKNGKD